VQLLSLVFLVIALSSSVAWAEVRTITATGEYRMGDNDTRADAKRIALQDAKRLALEKVGTYIESITEVKNLSLSKDEVRAYTAGIVEVTEQETRSTMEGQQQIVRMDVTCKIDADVVAKQIDALRKNETTKTELFAMKQEADRLRQELDAKTRELAAVKSKAEVETIAQARRKVLTGQDVNGLLAQAGVALAGSSLTMTVGSSSREGRRRARSLIEQALALAPSSPHAHASMGTLLMEEGNMEGAIAEYRTVIRLEPDDATNHNNLGGALQTKGDLEGAIAEYRTAIRLKPDDATHHTNLGFALETKGDLEGAIAEHRTAIRLKPDDATAHNNLGGALQTKGDLEGAIAEYKVGVRLKPNDAFAHYLLGKALKIKGQRAEAAREFRECLRLAPDTPAHRSLITTVQAALREIE